MNFIVDKQKAEKKWSPILESLTVKDSQKREWMAEYAELHQMNENVSYTTLGNINGMGAVVSPQPSQTPGYVWGADSKPGSGDIGQNLLPVSMKIAAQTIGLDLVAVKPAAAPKVDLLFMDFRYDDNNDEDSDRPLVFKINTSNIANVKTALYNQMKAMNVTEMIGGLDKRMFVSLNSLTSGATNAQIINFDPKTASSYKGWMEFLGFSRVDGQPMFRIFRQEVERGRYNSQNDDKSTFPWDSTSIIGHLEGEVLETATTTTVASTTLTGVTLELVSLMEDHIPGFVAGWNLFKGMNRQESENKYPGQIGPNVFTKTIQIGSIEITSAVKRTEIEDIKASTGMDIVQKLESVLINELSQVISKEIVQHIKELGEKNKASHTTPKTTTGVSRFDFDVDAYMAGTAPGGETTHSLQRKLITKINGASNFISQEGRVGAAQYIITNGNLGAVLADIATYDIAKVPGGANINTNGQLFPVGKVGSMTVYVDPNMHYNDYRIFLGRKNKADEPGLLFLPYLMAQSISLISEATFAPRMLIRSRYAIADVGFFPEKQFMAIKVKDDGGYLL